MNFIGRSQRSLAHRISTTCQKKAFLWGKGNKILAQGWEFHLVARFLSCRYESNELSKDFSVYLAKVICLFCWDGRYESAWFWSKISRRIICAPFSYSSFHRKMYQRISTSPSSHAFRSPGLLLFHSVKCSYTGNTAKHKACFISMTVLFSKFALGQTS